MLVFGAICKKPRIGLLPPQPLKAGSGGVLHMPMPQGVLHQPRIVALVGEGRKGFQVQGFRE